MAGNTLKRGDDLMKRSMLVTTVIFTLCGIVAAGATGTILSSLNPFGGGVAASGDPPPVTGEIIGTDLPLSPNPRLEGAPDEVNAVLEGVFEGEPGDLNRSTAGVLRAVGADTAVARSATAPDGTVLTVAPTADGLLCIADPQGSTGCASPVDFLNGRLQVTVQCGGLPTGTTAHFGALPEDVPSAKVQILNNPTPQDIGVSNSVYHERIGGVPEKLSWIDDKGPHTVDVPGSGPELPSCAS